MRLGSESMDWSNKSLPFMLRARESDTFCFEKMSLFDSVSPAVVDVGLVESSSLGSGVPDLVLAPLGDSLLYSSGSSKSNSSRASLAVDGGEDKKLRESSVDNGEDVAIDSLRDDGLDKKPRGGVGFERGDDRGDEDRVKSGPALRERRPAMLRVLLCCCSASAVGVVK